MAGVDDYKILTDKDFDMSATGRDPGYVEKCTETLRACFP
jgi:hypothetical protein